MIRVSVIDSQDLGAIRGSEDLTLVELHELLSQPIAEHKSSQPMVIGAVFAGQRRLKSECLTRNVIPVDLDDGSLSFQGVVDALVDMGLTAVVHTTASHSEKKPRLRAFVPMSRPVSAEEWPRVQAWIREAWDADPNAIDLPRISYAPMPIKGYKCELVEGSPLDVDSLPSVSPSKALTIRPTETVSSSRSTLLVEMLGSALPPIGHRHGFYLALSGFAAKQQLPMAETKAVVIALCTESGATDKISERLRLVETTYAKAQAGQQVAGEQALIEAMSHAVGTGAKTIVYQAARVMAGLPGKKERETPHGDKPSPSRRSEGKLEKVEMSDVRFDLQTLPEWEGVLAFDEFSQARTVVGKPPVRLDAEKGKWTDRDTTAIRAWFETARNQKVSRDMAEEALDLACHDNQTNSVTSWLDLLPAATGAIEELADTLGLSEPIERKMLRKWLLSAVARAYHPGAFLKSALVLQGTQNASKTSFLKTLFGMKYYVSVNADMSDDKRIGELVAGAWVVELEEGHATTRTDKAAMKRALSLQVDKFRPAYGRHAVERPRTCVFAVTTNADEFLEDETGNVRYYCVEVQDNMDLGRVEGIRDRVWAEARDAYRSGEAIWLTEKTDQVMAADKAKLFEVTDTLDEPIGAYLAGKDEVTTNDVIRHVSIAHDHLVKAGGGRTEHRVGRILRRLGCQKIRISGAKRWKVPERYGRLRAVK